MEGRIHHMRASGMKKLPRIHTAIWCVNDFFEVSDTIAGFSDSSFIRPANNLYKQYGSGDLLFQSVRFSGISFSKEGSRLGYSPSLTVYTMGSQPKLRKYFTKYTARCTPGPPAGGQ